MTNVYVIYGSESSVLSEFVDSVQDPIIRIYNNTSPLDSENCIDIHISQVNKRLSAELKNCFHKKIIFIGSAFCNQTSLFNDNHNANRYAYRSLLRCQRGRGENGED